MLPRVSLGGGGGRTGQACCFSPGRQWSLISCCGAHQCAASLSTLPSTSFPTLPSTLHVWRDTLYADQDAAFLSRMYMQVKLTTRPTVDFWELLTMSAFVFSCQCSLYFTFVTLMWLLLLGSTSCWSCQSFISHQNHLKKNIVLLLAKGVPYDE